MIYTLTFNPALDYIAHVDHFKVGTVNRTDFEKISFGGKGINVSYILNQLDIDNVALGFIAGFTGEAIEKLVQEQGITTDFIMLKDGLSRINLKLKSDQESEINGQGPLIAEEELHIMFQKLDSLKKNDILVLAGSIPNSLPDHIYEQILERLHNKEVRFVVDATKDLLVNVLKYHPFLIKPNHIELADIFHTTFSTEDDIYHYAKELQKLGARNVLVSMAGDGALLLSEHGDYLRMGAPKGIVKNSVGAGDSMVAGFLAGYMKTGDYKEALRLGTAAGSATAFSLELANRKFIDQLFLEL